MAIYVVGFILHPPQISYFLEEIMFIHVMLMHIDNKNHFILVGIEIIVEHIVDIGTY